MKKQQSTKAQATPNGKATPATNAPLFVVGRVPKLGSNNMHDTGRTWEYLAALLAKEPMSRAAMQQAVKEKYNHASFINYAIKNGWLVAA